MFSESLRQLLLVVFVGLAGCDVNDTNHANTGGGTGGRSGIGGASSGEPTAEVVMTCTAWDRAPIEGTSAVLVNNMWNEGWANGQPHTQCLHKQPKAGGGFRYGWRWDWPAYRPYSSYAAPEALVGWKAWDGGASTTPDLPKRLDALSSLKLGFAAEVTGDPTRNLNATMWLTKTDVAKEEIDPSQITSEIMVWFQNPGGLGGGNTSDGSVTLDGVTFDVSHLVNHGDDSGGTAQTWTMITYISRTEISEAEFDLNLVLKDVVSKGLAESSYAVGGVELITEIFGGAGSLWLNRFEVTVTTN